METKKIWKFLLFFVMKNTKKKQKTLNSDNTKMGGSLCFQNLFLLTVLKNRNQIGLDFLIYYSNNGVLYGNTSF